MTSIYASTEYVKEPKVGDLKLEVVSQWDFKTKPVCFGTVYKGEPQLLLEERINENESLLSVAEHEIDLGDKCYNHDKYTSACYACRKRKMYVEYSKDWQGSINERLQQLHHQTDNERSE
jgi:hypothetical protein